MGIGKSGRVESELRKYTVGFNTVPRPCGVLRTALYFFESVVVLVEVSAAAAAQVFAAEDVDFWQSFAW